MVQVDFSTCNPSNAKKYIREVYPSFSVDFETDNMKSFLEIVEKDIVRVQNPEMYGNTIAVVEGSNITQMSFDEVAKICNDIANELNNKAAQCGFIDSILINNNFL